MSEKNLTDSIDAVLISVGHAGGSAWGPVSKGRDESQLRARWISSGIVVKSGMETNV